MAKKRKKANKLKSNKSSTTEENFFVAIKNSNAVRIPLLENTKKILESMRLFQEIKEIRIEKIEEKRFLRAQMRQIYSKLNKIKAILPKVRQLPDSVLAKSQTREEVKKQPKQEKSVEVPKSHTELDRIESELAEIESRLSSLS